MTTYKTSEIASMIGIHPNTVRLYEELELIPKPQRQPNGYRIFSDLHVEHFQLARLAFQVEVLQNGLRKKMVQMVKVSAAGDYDRAVNITEDYLAQVRREIGNAKVAIAVVEQILNGDTQKDAQTYKRKEVSEKLNISMDTLRNWEMNGLLSVKRMQNGYRVYMGADIQRLKIIRSLRCANYSLESILSMLSQLDEDPQLDIKKALDTPRESSEIIAVCDKLLTSLAKAERNACEVMCKLKIMREKYFKPST
ncbi:MAG: MerR family transcriptional regulator [Lachnospiraceae bacterium]|jgi:DNA-binding transcriptional MerR regulator|nr:MerR family transcriptional regulator [Lachnospiraceae bacterium]